MSLGRKNLPHSWDERSPNNCVIVPVLWMIQCLLKSGLNRCLLLIFLGKEKKMFHVCGFTFVSKKWLTGSAKSKNNAIKYPECDCNNTFLRTQLAAVIAVLTVIHGNSVLRIMFYFYLKLLENILLTNWGIQ